MRLPTDKEMDVMEYMMGGQERHAYELVRLSEDTEHPLSRNSIYTVLMRMVARGLLSDRVAEPGEDETPGPPRRYYKITAEGLAAREARQVAASVMDVEGRWAPVPPVATGKRRRRGQ